MSIPAFQFTIKPFDGSGFANWLYRVRLLLEHHGVLGMISTVPPTNESELKTFKKGDVKARNLIVQALADSNLTMIKEKPTAKDIIDTLTGAYEKRGMKSIVAAQKAFMKLEYLGDKHLQQFIEEFEASAAEVNAAGGKLEEQEIVHQLLGAMPSEFGGVISALDILSKF